MNLGACLDAVLGFNHIYGTTTHNNTLSGLSAVGEEITFSFFNEGLA